MKGADCILKRRHLVANCTAITPPSGYQKVGHHIFVCFTYTDGFVVANLRSDLAERTVSLANVRIQKSRGR